MENSDPIPIYLIIFAGFTVLALIAAIIAYNKKKIENNISLSRNPHKQEDHETEYYENIRKEKIRKKEIHFSSLDKNSLFEEYANVNLDRRQDIEIILSELLTRGELFNLANYYDGIPSKTEVDISKMIILATCLPKENKERKDNRYNALIEKIYEQIRTNQQLDILVSYSENTNKKWLREKHPCGCNIFLAHNNCGNPEVVATRSKSDGYSVHSSVSTEKIYETHKCQCCGKTWDTERTEWYS